MSDGPAHTKALSATGEGVIDVVVNWLRKELKDPDIEVSDNFLDIGGHSLTFTKLNRFLNESHGVDLDIVEIYDKSLAEAAAGARPSA